MVEYLGWTGRASRRSFFLTFAVATAAGLGVVALTFGGSATGWPAFVAAGLGLFIIGWLQVMAAVRRLHDIGRTGWSAAGLAGAAILGSGIVPGALGRHGMHDAAQMMTGLQDIAAFLGAGALAFLLAWPGARGANRFGADPRARTVAAAAPPRAPARPVLPRPRPKLPPRAKVPLPVRTAPAPRASFGQRQANLGR